MKLELFLAADYANITGDGKINVMGIFREIHAPKFPTRHSSMHLVIKFRAELGEYGDSRNLHVVLQNPDGKELMRISGNMDIPKGGGGRIPEVNAIFELKDIVFDKPGPYQFVALIDKDHKGELTIFVNKLDPPA